MTESVGVFIDYENMHRTGHDLYARESARLYETVLDPIRVAETLVAKRSRTHVSTLTGVHVYRGRPVPDHQPKPASANDSQAHAWSADSRVRVIRRDLKYVRHRDGTFLAREKGIDVALAVGLTEAALDHAYDTAIVFSGDTDLLPALELIFRRGLMGLEIAAWSGQKPLWFPELVSATPPLRLPYCHFLDSLNFAACRDCAHPGGGRAS